MEKNSPKTSIFAQKYIYIPLSIVIITAIVGISNTHHQQTQETIPQKNQYTSIRQTCTEIEKIRPNTAIPLDPINISICTREALAYQYNNNMLNLNTQKNSTIENIKEYCTKNAEKSDINACIKDVSFIVVH